MDTPKIDSPVDSSTETDLLRVSPNENQDVQYDLKIKPQYLVRDQVSQVAMDYVSDRDKEKLTFLNEDKDKSGTAVTDKFNKRNRNILKGQNKSRAAFFHETFEQKICSSLRDVRPSSNPNEVAQKCANNKCRSIHDVNQYLQSKGDDIGATCYIYSIKGHCPYGVSCRFGMNHLTESGLNIVDEKKILEWESEDDNSQINYLNKSLQHLLWKRKYNFEKSESICKSKDEMRSAKDEPMEMDDEINGSVKNEIEDSEMGEVGPVVSATKERKAIDWKDKLYLSPLTTVGNLPFRRICVEYGADVTCAEMALATSLVQGKASEWAIIRRHKSEKLFGIQICGNNPYTMAKCAQLLEEQTDADFIDVNLGCPLDAICKTGCGSALLKKERFLKKTLQCMVLATDMPITIKTRIGFRKNECFLHKFMEDLGNIGLSLITIHGRTKEQRYTKTADWPYIANCAGLITTSQTAVFGNGDIFSYEDYNFVREKYKDLSGAMIGRAALIKPWIFTEIKEQKHIDISSQERFQLLQKYVNYGLEHWGSDNMGVEMTRRFLLEWLSFLCRYTPVGILEHVPQKINQRVPSYIGRDDLETLFASQNCSDWIKISEMFLGRVPHGFQFLPKHKASAWR